MLLQVSQLCADTDGRYASDAELKFFQAYLKTAKLRFSLYRKLQTLEKQLIQDVLKTLKETDPDLLIVGGQDLTAKWQRDTVRTLRYAVAAMLTDDPEMFKERMLLWFQTIMKSFRTEKSCEATYRSMQAVIQKFLTPEEADLFCPLLEMSRSTLGDQHS